jgi:hypothetical protein
MNGAIPTFKCERCFWTKKKCKRTSKRYQKMLDYALKREHKKAANAAKKPPPQPPRMPRARRSHINAIAGPSQAQPPRTPRARRSHINAIAGPSQAPAPVSVPRAPSHHSNFLLDFLTIESALHLPDRVELLRTELSRANSTLDSAAAYRSTIHALLLAALERQVFESLPSGSRSSRVEPAVPAKRKATSSGEGTSRDKGKGRAEPEEESEDATSPSDDESDFEGGV